MVKSFFNSCASGAWATRPRPTPNWRAPLLAAYLEACGEALDRSELSGMNRTQASSFIDEGIRDCQDQGNEGNGKGKGNGKGRGGRD